MANIRLALLSAVALVAVIAPLIESRLFERLKGRIELRKRLELNVLEPKEIKSILKLLYFIDRDAEIGEMKVIEIMDKRRFILGKNKKLARKFSEQRHNIFEEKDCARDAILAHFEGIMSSNLNTVLNVCKFVHSEWMSYCEDNIRQVHKDEKQIRDLGAKELEPKQVREILDSIGDKRDVKFLQTSVESLLKQSPPGTVSTVIEYCMPDAIDARESYLKHPNRILVSNLQNFDEALDPLLSLCAHYIRTVFEISTASITTEIKRRIRAALPKESARDWFGYIKWGAVDSHLMVKIYEDGIENSCKKVGKSVAYARHIKRRAETSLSESLDKLLGDEWVELEHDCFYYLSCYVNYHTNERQPKFCDERPNNVKFLQITSGATQWRLLN